VQAGLATDSVGELRDWSVFARWKRTVRKDVTWSPSLRYTVMPGATPFELGLSHDGNFENVLELHVHTGMQYWSTETDPGTFVLNEPRVTIGSYFVNGMLFVSDKGEVPSPNVPRRTSTWIPLDDFVFQTEPLFGGEGSGPLASMGSEIAFTV
jgi:hypothetical protein